MVKLSICWFCLYIVSFCCSAIFAIVTGNKRVPRIRTLSVPCAFFLSLFNFKWPVNDLDESLALNCSFKLYVALPKWSSDVKSSSNTSNSMVFGLVKNSNEYFALNTGFKLFWIILVFSSRLPIFIFIYGSDLPPISLDAKPWPDITSNSTRYNVVSGYVLFVCV